MIKWFKFGAAASVVALSLISAAHGQQQSLTAPPAFKTYPARPTAPKGAPNILLIMTDDVGFGATSAFGGPVPTPVYEKLAAAGLRYNEFHTTAMCSPTRAALLTGRNHHRVGAGSTTGVSIDSPGYNSVIPDSASTIADVLKANGYDTAFLGKHHNTPQWETTPLGPFDRWPNGLGFDYFYGFLSGWTNQFAPALIENRNTVRLPHGDPNYILERDLADHAIKWVDLQQSLSPDRPFMLYYAPGTNHSPHQAPAEFLARFRGKFDQGWDKLREQSFARQKAAGIIPKNAELTPRPAQIPAWSSLTPEQKKVAARQMEASAAMMAYHDSQVGRIIEELKKLNVYDNTLVIYIQGDNGASAENFRGTNNDFSSINNNEPSWEYMAQHIDELGTAKSWGNYHVGWAWSLDTPFQWSKQIASHLGGTRNGLVISWPKGIAARGEVRSQFHHVIDIAPTIYDAIGAKAPATFEGVEQLPIDGVSMTYSFADPKAPTHHREQYFELLGNRAFYKDGWIASTTPGAMPWDHSPTNVDPDSFKWELYNLNTDYSQAHDLAGRYPEKLAELQQAFDVAAKANDVYPITANFIARFNPKFRPSFFANPADVTFYPGAMRYPDSAFPNFANRSWTAAARLKIKDGDQGTIISQGGWVMGWGLYIIDGRPTFTYRASDHDPEIRISGARLSAGDHLVTSRFIRDAASRGGKIQLEIDGKVAAEAPVPLAVGFRGLYATVGQNGDEVVAKDTPLDFPFTGDLTEVRITLQ